MAARLARRWLVVAFAWSSVLLSVSATAQPVGISYTITGTPGDWTLEFAVSNRFSSSLPSMQVYFVGVSLPVRDITGSPASWDPNIHTSYGPPPGGSSTVYNNIWYRNPPSAPALAPGQTLTGFRTHVTTVDPPESVRWWYYAVEGQSRFNIWVDAEGGMLADTAVSTTITSSNGVPVLVERAMWWPGPTAETWAEAHNSPGTTSAGTLWALAEGECGPGMDTYVLVANTSPFNGEIRVTLLFEDGSAPVVQNFPVSATSRFNIVPAVHFPVACPAGTSRSFGMLVESVGTGGNAAAQIVVERAMYSDANGTHWAAGTNALGTRLK